MFFSIQKNIDKFLSGIIERGDVGGVYLFSGGKDLGKREVALKFLSSFFCEKNKKIPCQKCSSCELFAKRTHPNFYELVQTGERQEIVIDQVRSLKLNLQKRAIGNNAGKAVLIDDADHLNVSSANALLKILEEPTGKTIFVLLDHRRQPIAPTIISRCQIVRFLPSSSNEIKVYLENKTSSALPSDIIEFSNWRYRKAEKYVLEPIIWKSHRQILDGLLEEIIFFREIDLLAKVSGSGNLAKQKESIIELVENYQFIWHNILLFKLGLPTYLQTHYNLEQLRKFLAGVSLSKIVQRLEAALRVLSRSGQNLPVSTLLAELIFF